MTAAVHAELRKLASLPAIWWTVALSTAVTALLTTGHVDPVGYAQVGFLLLGALATTSEYAGQAATSLLCVPGRVQLLAAKAVSLALLTIPVATTVALIGGSPARAGVYLVLTALFAAATGVLLRGGVATVAVLLGHYVVAGPLLGADWLPGPHAGTVTVLLWTVAGCLVAAGTSTLRDA